MNGWVRWSLAATFVLVVCWILVNPGPSAVMNPKAARTSSLIELLPESTVMAVEIRDVARRWSEIRDVPVIRGLQDRLLEGTGLEPDDLPRLAGERAVLALITSADGSSLTPLAVLRPPRLDEAEAILRRAGSAGDGLALTTHRAGSVLWVAGAEASVRPDRLALVDDVTGRHRLPIGKVARRLPEGGLVRGWIDPDALRSFLLARADGVDPPAIDLFRTFVAAELDAARYIGFRRDLADEGLVTDAVIGFDPGALPPEVARVLATPADSPPVLPAPLPAGVLVAGAFRTEAAATWEWLHHVAALDSRGPLRNFEFWVDEFQDRYGRDLKRDLVDALGERGWFFISEGETIETLQALLIVETRDAARAEETLVDLGSWLVDHAWGRSLGLFSPRMHVGTLDGFTAHGVSFWTPFAELPGPAFLVTEEHVVIGSGTSTLGAGLELLRDRETWRPVAVTTKRPVPFPNESVRVRGSALSRWFDTLAAREAPRWSGAISGLESLAADVWYEGDVIRVHGEVRVE